MIIEWREELYGWEQLKEDPFTKEEYIALNENFQLTKFDPLFIKDNLPFIAKNLQSLFEGFVIYQFSKTSKYRYYPLRIIYSKHLGKAFELKGTNENIYEIMRYLRATSEKFSTDESTLGWIKENLYNYILFFFDNVTGKLGRFELINFEYRHSPLSQIINRVNTYYKLQNNNVKNGLENLIIETENLYKNEFKNNDLKMPLNYKMLLEISLQFFFSDRLVVEISPVINKESNTISVHNFYMIFKNALFKADVQISLNKDYFGHLILFNEKVISIKPIKDKEHKILFEISSHGSDDTDVLTSLPYFEEK